MDQVFLVIVTVNLGINRQIKNIRKVFLNTGAGGNKLFKRVMTLGNKDAFTANES